MAHSLETRGPFLDNDLVDFDLKVPNSMKVTNNHEKVNENDLGSKIQATKSGKVVLRKTLSKYLTDKITNNKKNIIIDKLQQLKDKIIF